MPERNHFFLRIMSLIYKALVWGCRFVKRASQGGGAKMANHRGCRLSWWWWCGDGRGGRTAAAPRSTVASPLLLPPRFSASLSFDKLSHPQYPMPLTLGRPSVTQPSQRITFQCFVIFGEEELNNLPLFIVGKTLCYSPSLLRYFFASVYMWKRCLNNLQARQALAFI